MTRSKIPQFLVLILFQVLPVIIVLYHMYNYNKSTENPGWIFEQHTGCKFYTGRNYENRDFVWNGDCQEGFVHGFGELTLFQNGLEYYAFEGFLSKGRFEGAGKLIIRSDGDTYEGNYEDGKPNGFGHFYNDDGDHYEGTYKEGIRSGNGTYWYSPESNLFKYEGEWKEGRENGKGTLFYRNGKKKSGTFKDGFLEE